MKTIGILCFCLLLGTSVSFSQNPSLFRIGTGGLQGVYYPIGKLIAQGLTSRFFSIDKPGDIAETIFVAQTSGGSVANIFSLLEKETEGGLVQADIAYWAYSGKGPFEGLGQPGPVRAIASLYSEKMQIVVRKDAQVGSFEQLRGKMISLDEAGSGTLTVMRILLDAHRMSETDVKPVYLKPEFTVDRFIKNELQGFCIMAGVPVSAIERLPSADFFLVPIDRQIADRIHQQHPYLFPGHIPAGVYRGIEETATIEVYALLVVHQDLPNALAYALTESLWSKEILSLVNAGHAQGASITLETALNGISIPLHPGALRFYTEQGMVLEQGP